MSFQGSLRDFYLPEFIQMAEAASKSGRFVLRRDSRTGHIYLEEGQIVHAEVNGQTGEDAVFDMAVWVDGSFTFENNVQAPVHSIKRSNANLMVQAARRLDEWRVLSKKIPSVEMIPEFVPQGKGQAPQISLSTKEWVLLSKVNGLRNISTIAEQAGINTFDACKILYGLIASGLLKLKSEATVSAAATAPAVTTAPQPQRAPVSPASKPVERASVGSVVERIKDLSHSAMGRMGDAIIDKQLRKCGVDASDANVARQLRYLRKALERIQQASAVLIGADTAASMVLKMEEEVDRLEQQSS
ncbi:MAG: DUF4388 domain-containing protein [Candidatus Schekmanbacteria bacterium]|nr:DUF4388 domain-containing protein [Candidatus Schekmanbacteria bacterium]